MSAGTGLPDRPSRDAPAAETPAPPPREPRISPWLERHRDAVLRGGYLGADWGDDAYVDGVVERFLLPHLPRAGVALEIGPGGGRYTERLLPHVRELHAVDSCGEILSHMTERLGAVPALVPHRGDGRTLAAIGDGSVDLAFSFNLFLFLDLETIHGYLEEFRRVLSPSGYGVIQYADFSSEGGLRTFLANRERWRGSEGSGEPFGRFRYFTKDFMARLLDSAGLAPIVNASHRRDAMAGFVRSDGGASSRHVSIARAAEATRRPETTPAGLDLEEAAWWERHAASAERIAWVQTESVRRLVRGRYVRKIVAAVPPGGTVLDYGCGAGWLARLLASYGARSVVGLDDSREQIEIARAEAARSAHAGALRFLVGRDVPADFRADVAVCHAVLHHLSWSEIRSVLERLRRALVPGGTLFLLEPVAGSRPYAPWSALPDALVRLFSDRGGRRRTSDAEKTLRASLDASRSGPRLPFRGPSPKEMPFRPGEIEARVGFAGGFRLVSSEPAIFRTHHVAAENLLFSATYPRLGAFLRAPALALAAAWERASFARLPADSWEGWVFRLYRFTAEDPVTEAESTSTPA